MMVWKQSPLKLWFLGFLLICFLSTGCKAKPPSVISTILSSMSPVVNGQGVPQAGEYDPDGMGPHTVVILPASGTEYDSRNEDLPFGWLPSSLSETELVVLIWPEQEVVVGSQSYTGGHVITAHRHTAQAELREARTGRTLAAAEIWGPPPPPFPYAAPSNQTSIGGGSVTHEAIERWLCLNLKGQGCWEPVQTLTGHTDDVLSVAISPDGRTIASGSSDDKIILWDIASGSEIQTLAGHTGGVKSIAFSPDGRIIASSGSMGNTIILWDVASGVEMDYLVGHENQPICVAFSPDGHTIASGSLDDKIILWDVASGTQIKTLKTKVHSLAFSPDGRILASGTDFGGSVILWDVVGGEKLHTLETQEDYNTVAFSPDGRILASGSDNGAIILWDVTSGSRLQNLFGLTDIVSSVAFLPDGSTLISGSYDGKVVIWKVKD